MTVPEKQEKMCKCGPPYYYSPHMPGGTCRFCWRYKFKHINPNGGR